MVKFISILILISISGCSLFQPKPCNPVIVKVPYMVKPDIPVIDRPVLSSQHLTADATTDQTLKTIQSDVVQLIDYAKSLELIMNVVRSNNVIPVTE